MLNSILVDWEREKEKGLLVLKEHTATGGEGHRTGSSGKILRTNGFWSYI